MSAVFFFFFYLTMDIKEEFRSPDDETNVQAECNKCLAQVMYTLIFMFQLLQ